MTDLVAVCVSCKRGEHMSCANEPLEHGRADPAATCACICQVEITDLRLTDKGRAILEAEDRKGADQDG